MACRHRYTGFVTNQDPSQPLDLHRAHMSESVCDREECRAAVIRKVAGFTNETAAYYPFGNYRKATAR